MSENRLHGRIVNKHDVEANWLKATNFTPMLGEIIIYDVDETHDLPRIKVGDGKTLVSSLPFTDEPITNEEIDEICGAMIYMASEVML